MTVNTQRPNFSRQAAPSLSGQRLYLREEELDAGLAMIFDANNAIKSATLATCETNGLNWTQARALATLLRLSLGVKDLSDSLGVTKQAAIKTAEDLEGRGLITRSLDAKDGRRRMLILTECGETIARQVATAMRATLGHAYRTAGGDAVAGCDAVLSALKGGKAVRAVRQEVRQS
jgi:DNA-binding MarR family transcriptional regulator